MQAAPRFSGFGFGFSLSICKGSKGSCIGLTINQVGHVLWSIYKMSNLFE